MYFLKLISSWESKSVDDNNLSHHRILTTVHLLNLTKQNKIIYASIKNSSQLGRTNMVQFLLSLYAYNITENTGRNQANQSINMAKTKIYIT